MQISFAIFASSTKPKFKVITARSRVIWSIPIESPQQSQFKNGTFCATFVSIVPRIIPDSKKSKKSKVLLSSPFFISVSAGRTETSGAPFGRVKIIRYLDFGEDNGRNHKLSDSFTRIYSKRFVRVIYDGY